MEQQQINISGLDKKELLRKLWENSQVASFFTMNHMPPPKLNEKELTESVNGYVDYLCGRVIKCDLTGNMADPQMYDRDNGKGAFEKIVIELRDANKN